MQKNKEKVYVQKKYIKKNQLWLWAILDSFATCKLRLKSEENKDRGVSVTKNNSEVFFFSVVGQRHHH